MSKKHNILKIWSFTLSLMMLTVFFTKDLVSKHQSKQSKKADKEEQTQLSELSSDYVIPSNAFTFNTDFVLIPKFVFTIEIVESVFKTVSKPLYRLSYFEKIFERHIAINAP